MTDTTSNSNIVKEVLDTFVSIGKEQNNLDTEIEVIKDRGTKQRKEILSAGRPNPNTFKL